MKSVSVNVKMSNGSMGVMSFTSLTVAGKRETELKINGTYVTLDQARRMTERGNSQFNLFLDGTANNVYSSYLSEHTFEYDLLELFCTRAEQVNVYMVEASGEINKEMAAQIKDTRTKEEVVELVTEWCEKVTLTTSHLGNMRDQSLLRKLKLNVVNMKDTYNIRAGKGDMILLRPVPYGEGDPNVKEYMERTSELLPSVALELEVDAPYNGYEGVKDVTPSELRDEVAFMQIVEYMNTGRTKDDLINFGAGRPLADLPWMLGYLNASVALETGAILTKESKFGVGPNMVVDPHGRVYHNAQMVSPLTFFSFKLSATALSCSFINTVSNEYTFEIPGREVGPGGALNIIDKADKVVLYTLTKYARVITKFSPKGVAAARQKGKYDKLIEIKNGRR